MRLKGVVLRRSLTNVFVDTRSPPVFAEDIILWIRLPIFFSQKCINFSFTVSCA